MLMLENLHISVFIVSSKRVENRARKKKMWRERENKYETIRNICVKGERSCTLRKEEEKDEPK